MIDSNNEPKHQESYIPNKNIATSLHPIQDGHVRGSSGWGGGGKKAPIPKICHTYPIMMKLSRVISIWVPKHL